MARSTAKSEAEKSPYAELVHPDGERKETPLNASRDTQLRFQGWLPEDQRKLEGPARRVGNSSTLEPNEKTESTPTSTGGN